MTSNTIELMTGALRDVISDVLPTSRRLVMTSERVKKRKSYTFKLKLETLQFVGVLKTCSSVTRLVLIEAVGLLLEEIR